jgi:hypothetical protein
MPARGVRLTLSEAAARPLLLFGLPERKACIRGNRIAVHFLRNLGYIAVVSGAVLKLAPYVGRHTEFVPSRVGDVAKWLLDVDHFMFGFVFVYVMVVLNYRWLWRAKVFAVVTAALLSASRFSAMTVPFDGRLLELVLARWGVTDADLIADIKNVLALFSPLTAWLVLWIEAHITRARAAKGV